MNTLSRFLLTFATLIACSVIWWQGLQGSMLLNPELAEQHKNISRSAAGNSPDLQAEQALARAYWLRYPDIRQDTFFGENGTMGIFGPRAHYNQHGRHEQRILALVQIPNELDLEQELAEAYWSRYPDIERSMIWGRKSKLGILGPRDHYLHFGKAADLTWGSGMGEAAPSP